MQRLKPNPCTNCGSTYLFINKDNSPFLSRKWVQCLECEQQGPSSLNIDVAKIGWNDRNKDINES